MSWKDKLLSFVGTERVTITLEQEEREGGYIFISSPELKGFSLLLAPGNYDDFKEFIDAVHEPLITYMRAYDRARNIARSKNLRLRGTKLSETGVVAKMCFQ